MKKLLTFLKNLIENSKNFCEMATKNIRKFLKLANQ